MTTAAELHALQQTDLALDRGLARLDEIDAQLGESEEVEEARQRVQEKRELVTGLHSRQKELEWAVDEVRVKAAGVEKKLYGGSVRNPKELEDLHADLAAIQGQVRKREDALLAVLVELEEAEAGLQEAESALSDLEARWGAAQSALEAEKGRLQPEVLRLQEQRSRQSGGMEGTALHLYQTLRERRGGQAVASVERGMCQGCRISLPMSLLQKARASLALVQCVSCERILLVS